MTDRRIHTPPNRSTRAGEYTSPACLGLRSDVLSALCLDQLVPLFSAETLLDHLDRR